MKTARADLTERPDAALALFWDDNQNCARLFTNPHYLISTDSLSEALPALSKASEEQHWLAGGLPYQTGLASEERLAHLSSPSPLWFGCFPAPQILSFSEMQQWLAEQAGGNLPPVPAPKEPHHLQSVYLEAVTRAQELIRAGDIYQVNLGFSVELPHSIHPCALFASLFHPEVAPHGGLLHDGRGKWWISLSPELFFETDGRHIKARPMKGTASRHLQANADKAVALALQADQKNRAENLMITDLLRNDLAKVARPGSVKTPQLFHIETYPSVHQMTSTVTAELADDTDAIDALAALFPCGSITGAPKIRAMEVIAELEQAPRGIWCGAIGWIAPDAQSSHFSVAIRTIEAENHKARLKVGSGIVADSDPISEWVECLSKSRFLQRSGPKTLIETMRMTKDGIPLLHRHMDRLAHSAHRFGFAFDYTFILQKIEALEAPKAVQRLRLLLSKSGEISLQQSALPTSPDQPVEVGLCLLPVEPDDWRLFHKSSDRQFHDETRRQSGHYEILWHRKDGLVTEGSFTNIFVEKNGHYLTPSATLGLLPGVLRAELLENGASEAELTVADIQSASDEGRLFIGNALRGLMSAHLAVCPPDL